MSKLPSRISRYEINSLIGAGGMGAVYLARDTNPNTNRLVALKVLTETLDPQLRARFVREARVLAALDHPNIVRIYDSGEFEGAPFIVMEYVRGESLAEKIKRKAPMPVGQKLKLMVELCSGLAQAHEAGIVHRDIKPANLIVDQSGRLKILDFGIARATEGTLFGSSMTLLNMRIGTPGYMSPEQLAGGDIDGRTDIFAAGAVCYALLAYRDPFSGASAPEVETAVLEATPERLCVLVPGLDPRLEAIVNKALAKDPRERFQNAAAFEQALEAQRRAEDAREQRPAATPATVAATPKTVLKTVAKTVAVAPAGPGQRTSRADAAYQRALANYRQGALDVARRFAMEALAEDPTHRDARALVDRLGGAGLPLPIPADEPDPDATLVTVVGRPGTPVVPSAPTVLSTAPAPARPRPAERAAAVWARHGKTLQIAAVAAGVIAVLAVAALLAFWLWPGGPQLRITRPTGGTVWAEGITCGTKSSDCTTNTAEGDWIELRAEADAGYVFAGFEGDCSKSGRVHMVRASSCAAIFNPLPKESEKGSFALTVVRPTNGMVVGPGGIRCGSVDSACTMQYPEGTEVTLAAYADLNFVFRGFTGDCSESGVTAMTAARTCAATFVAEQKAATASGAPPAPRAPSARTSTRAGGTPIESLLPALPPSNTGDPLAPKADVKDRVAAPLSPDELAQQGHLETPRRIPRGVRTTRRERCSADVSHRAERTHLHVRHIQVVAVRHAGRPRVPGGGRGPGDRAGEGQVRTQARAQGGLPETVQAGGDLQPGAEERRVAD